MKTSCAALLLAVLALPSLAAPSLAECDSGTAIVVRHGEKLMTGDAEKDRDAPLSEAGKERAEALAAALSEAGIDAVYSSPYLRTRGTVEPLAAKLSLEVATYSVAEKDAQDRIAAKVMAENCGREVLIAGHSNTVPDLLRAFGVAQPEEIADQQFDHLYLVRWRKGAPAELLTLHYGRPTP